MLAKEEKVFQGAEGYRRNEESETNNVHIVVCMWYLSAGAAVEGDGRIG